MKRIILLSLAAVGLTAGGCATLDMNQISAASSKVLQAYTLTDAQIESYVAEYIAQLDAGNTIATGTDPYAVRLERIAGAINNRNGINIKVYKTQEVNAFAVANGSVRIYSGLMDIMTDEEVLGVIGHEIGHISNKDTKDAFRNALLTSAARSAVASTGQTMAALSASQWGDLGEAYAQARYSQKQEYEADRFGYEFLKGAGLNPWAMALSLEKLKQLEASGQTTGAIQQLFSTHPDLANRTQRLADRATQEGYAKPK
jgi:putative metalloprotease